MANERSLEVFQRAFEAASKTIRENQQLSERIRDNWGPEYAAERSNIENIRLDFSSLKSESNP